MTDSPTPRNAMTKADLINIVAKKLDITQVQSGIIVEAALKSVVSGVGSAAREYADIDAQREGPARALLRAWARILNALRGAHGINVYMRRY